MTNLTNTPWGRVQDMNRLSPRITFVSTTSHGGVYCDATATRAITTRYPGARGSMIGAGIAGPDGGTWWEQDCAIAFAVATFPEAFRRPGETVEQTRDAAERLILAVLTRRSA